MNVLHPLLLGSSRISCPFHTLRFMRPQKTRRNSLFSQWPSFLSELLHDILYSPLSLQIFIIILLYIILYYIILYIIIYSYDSYYYVEILCPALSFSFPRSIYSLWFHFLVGFQLLYLFTVSYCPSLLFQRYKTHS